MSIPKRRDAQLYAIVSLERSVYGEEKTDEYLPVEIPIGSCKIISTSKATVVASAETLGQDVAVEMWSEEGDLLIKVLWGFVSEEDLSVSNVVLNGAEGSFWASRDGGIPKYMLSGRTHARLAEIIARPVKDTDEASSSRSTGDLPT